MLFYLDLCVGLYLEHRGISMAGHHLEACKILLRDEKCDQRGIISRHVIAPSRLQLPGLALQQADVSGCLKHLLHRGHGVEYAGALSQEIQQLLGDLLKCKCSLFHDHTPFPIRYVRSLLRFMSLLLPILP